MSPGGTFFPKWIIFYLWFTAPVGGFSRKGEELKNLHGYRIL
jgi:hypothetical protein